MITQQEYDERRRLLSDEIATTEKIINEKRPVFIETRKPFQERIIEKQKEIEPLLTPLRQKYTNFKEYVEYAKALNLSISEERIAAYESKLEKDFREIVKPIAAIEKEQEETLKDLAEELTTLTQKLDKLKYALSGLEEFERT